MTKRENTECSRVAVPTSQLQIALSEGAMASEREAALADLPTMFDEIINKEMPSTLGFGYEDEKGGNSLANMSFQNLLAMAHAQGHKAVQNVLRETGFVAPSSGALHFSPPTASQITMNFVSSSLQYCDNSVGSIFEDGGSIPAGHFFNLNSLPSALAEALSGKSMPPQFQPITPEKNDKQSDALQNKIIGDRGRVIEPQEKEMSQMVFGQVSAAMSAQLQENHKPDKGGTEEVDLIKNSQQQKPRRRKHRPKVVIEGQNKSTPKPTEGKSTVPQETRVKRKYVRRKGVVSPLECGLDGADLNKTTPDPKHNSSVATPTIPQETRVKRKYVRRKGINTCAEGGIDGTESITASDPVQKSGGKGKYVRKKGMNKVGADLDSNAKADVVHHQRTRSSCKKSLNFNCEGQASNENSPYIPSSNYQRESQSENFSTGKGQCTQEIIEMMEKTGTVNSHEWASSMTQLRRSYTESMERHFQSNSPPINMYPIEDSSLFTDQILCTRGKCQIVFSDVTHDKETNIVQMRMNPNDQWSPKSPRDSICSNTCLNLERQERGLKREKMATTFIGELSNRNESGFYYNSVQKYNTVFSQNADTNDGAPGLDFAASYKKTRTEMGHNRVTSSLQYAASTSVNHMVFGRQTCSDSYTNLLVSTRATCSAENGRQVFENLLALGPAAGTKRRRSQAPSQLKNLDSLVEMHKGLPAAPSRAATTSRTEQGIEILPEAHTCFEALVAGASTNVPRKKQTKGSTLDSSTLQYNLQNLSTMSTGPPLALTWTSALSIDLITEQLDQLDLNAKDNQGLAHMPDTLAAYNRYYQEQHAIVPFQGYGSVVPFDGSFNQVRRRRPRPKVDLDDETTRVWKLLLENINNEGIDGTDEQKAKWWEEERRVFNGRADSFIARMHLVQGDRRFSPWKGSVVDSVVGVFLTQNVSDHLSSSAYMSLAAQFPIGAKTTPVELNEKGQGVNIKEPQVYEMDPNETFALNKDLTNPSPYDKGGVMLHDYKDGSIREVSSVKPAGKSFDGFISSDNLKGQPTDASNHSPSISHDTATKNSVSLIEDGRDSEDTLSSQNSTESPVVQTAERSNSCSISTSEQEATTGLKPNRFNSSTSFVKLLQMASTTLHGVYERTTNENLPDLNCQGQSESLSINFQNHGHLDNATLSRKSVASSSKSPSSHVINLGGLATAFDLSHKTSDTSNISSKKEHCNAEKPEISGLTSESTSQTTFQKFMAVGFEEGNKLSCLNAQSSDSDHSEINQASEVPADSMFQERNFNMQEVNPIYPQNMTDVTGSSSNLDNLKSSEHREVNSNKNDPNYHAGKTIKEYKVKEVRAKKEKEKVDWEHLRKQAQPDGRGKAKTANTLDSVDWDAVRCADVNVIAQTIKERGMNNMLAERIKAFLNRLVNDHGSIDLEWLRDVPPDKAKEYLLSFRGLGLKSVECVRLLTLHHLAFPVDTNVGRIAVRLGWVPLQPLPESLQLHLLELYPVLESIQKYLWPRLCKLDQRTLYELHYQMITFGKVFCTKSKPNCNACPMRGECRHFASAFASARLALPAPGEKSIMCTPENKTASQSPWASTKNLQLLPPHTNQINSESRVSNPQPIIEEPATPEPTVEVPTTPETYTQVSVCDIEGDFNEEPDEIPTIQLNMEEFTHNLQKIMQQNGELQEADMSKALVALTSEVASIPVPKLKNVNGLRTEHHVYELPDSHPLLEGMDKREVDDPCPYLLAIWTPGETVDSIEPPATRCSSQGYETLCTDETCSSCNSIREANAQTVRGTLLIPCRTAMKGRFPLNGTYFQVNEVFSDHESSLLPMDVPRGWLWNLARRTVYFGTSIPTIFKGLTTEQIQHCFWRGFVCVRGFDRKIRAPRPLIARLHFPASRLGKGKRKIDENHQ